MVKANIQDALGNHYHHRNEQAPDGNREPNVVRVKAQAVLDDQAANAVKHGKDEQEDERPPIARQLRVGEARDGRNKSRP